MGDQGPELLPGTADTDGDDDLLASCLEPVRMEYRCFMQGPADLARIDIHPFGDTNAASRQQPLPRSPFNACPGDDDAPDPLEKTVRQVIQFAGPEGCSRVFVHGTGGPLRVVAPEK